MSTVDQDRAADNRSEHRPVDAIKVQVMGGAVEAAAVLRRLHAQRIAPVDYSIVSGEIAGSMCLTIVHRNASTTKSAMGSLHHPEQLLASVPSVLRVTDVRESARRHLRMIVTPTHPDAPFFQNAIQELGGHIQGSDRKK